MLVAVVDENNVAVPAAQVTLTEAGGPAVSRGDTDHAGRHLFRDLHYGNYELRVAKEGFYEVIEKEVRVGETERAEVTLNHQREFSESVNVIYSPPAIDPAKTTSSKELTSSEIINLPYTVSRDIRYALPLLPGVLQDGGGVDPDMGKTLIMSFIAITFLYAYLFVRRLTIAKVEEEVDYLTQVVLANE